MAEIKTDADIAEGLAALCVLDPALVAVVAGAGPVPLRLSEPGFAGLAHIVVSQVVSKASAAAIWRRMEAQGPVSAEAWLLQSRDDVSRLGLSGAKVRTLDGLAHAVTEGSLDLEALADLDPQVALAQLTALPGIGPWTAEVYLMFCLGDADLFPAGDVALRAAVGHAFGLEMRPSVRQTAEMAFRWRPWRAVAARLFWAYYARAMRRDVLPTG